MIKTHIVATLLGGLLTVGVIALAQPKQNISAKRHPNLEAAQQLSEEAYQKITAAQQANEFDMQGHAAQAKALLEKVNNQLRMAATAANKNAK